VEWSGVVRGCSHFVRDDPDDHRHIMERLAEQLAVAGIPETLPADLGWLKDGAADRFDLPPAYALIVPGGAPHRPEKRAPAESFAALGRHMIGQGIVPVMLGTDSERGQIDAISAACPGAVDLSDRTGFGDIADLARGAAGAVGNDTGAMHLTAAIGCASLVLFSSASDPRRVRPQGRRVHVLQTEALRELSAGELIAAWERLRADR
jgi:ADP-heptose:LPS heptosyltransferase